MGGMVDRYDSARDGEGFFVCAQCGHRFDAREALTDHREDSHWD